MKLTTADRLKEVMRERRLRQADIVALAQPYCEEYRVKLGKSDLSQYVSGRVVPGQSKLFVLARALNVNEAWLMGYDVSPERCSEEEPQEETRAETYQRIMKEEAAVQWYNSLNEEQKRLINLLAYLPSDKVDSLLNFAESWMPPQTQEND